MNKWLQLLFLTALSLFFAGSASAQGSLANFIVWKYTPAGAFPAGGATVTICTSTATGTPCTPTISVFSDSALSAPVTNPLPKCTTSPQFGCIDGMGNVYFYVNPGNYSYSVTGAGLSAYGPIPLELDAAATLFSGVPSGVCGSRQTAIDTLTGDFYDCIAGVFQKVGPGGNPGVLTSPVITPNPLGLDVDLAFKGPNPYHDVARYGASASTTATTASTTNGSTGVTLAAAIDFQDASSFPGTSVGNGIVIYKAGAASGLTTPPAPTVTPFGVTGGGTTYNYKYVAEDQQGGLTAAGAVGTTATGASALGVTTVTLTDAAWVNTLNGEQNYTCSGNCNTQDGSPVRIDGFVTNHFNGNYTIVSHADPTHFTVYSPATPTVTSETHAATAKLLACNILTMAANTTATTETGGETVLRWYIYRNNVLAGYAQSRDPYYEDCGVTTPGGNFASYVPTSPGAAVNKYLVTTIVSGAGTVNIVVANAAGANTAGATALHDNSQNLLAATNASHFSSPVYMSVNSPFNAATIFTNANAGSTHIIMPYGVTVNQPWVVMTNGVVFEGGTNRGTNSFDFGDASQFGASAFAYPGVVVQSGHTNNTMSGVNFKNLTFSGVQLGQIPFVVDVDVNTLFGLMMDNVSFFSTTNTANVNFPAARFTGISESNIGMPGNRNACSVAQLAVGPPCMRFTTVSTARNSGASGTANMARDTQINGFAMQGGGSSFQFDTLPWINSGGTSPFGPSDDSFVDGLREIGMGPYLRTNLFGTSGAFYISGIDDDAPNASQGNGWVDNGAGTGLFVQAARTNSSVGGQVLVAGPATVVSLPGNIFAVGTTNSGFSGAPGTNGNGNVSATGTALVLYNMPAPAAPGLAAAAGTNIAAGTHTVALIWFDALTNYSFVGPTASITTVGGTQNINVTPPAAPVGAAGYLIVIDSNVAANGANCNFRFVTPATLAATNVFAPVCASVTQGNAASGGLSSAGVLAGVLTMPGLTLASLGTPGDGTFKFCVDCTIANPCAGGGTGALAKRLNGTWICN